MLRKSKIILSVLIIFILIIGCGTEELPQKKVKCIDCPFEMGVEKKNGILNNASCSLIDSICFSRIVIGDTLSFYLGRRKDTVFLLQPTSIDFSSPQKITFLPINSKVNDYYSYGDFTQYDEDLILNEDAVEVKVNSVDILNGDTVYTFSHTCRPAEIIEITKDSGVVIPRIERSFVLSLRFGVLSFQEKRIEGYKEIGFSW